MAERRVGARFQPCVDGKLGHPLSSCEVLDRMCNHSAFNGYHWTPSDWSAISCTACGAFWRTKADYVRLLSDARR